MVREDLKLDVMVRVRFVDTNHRFFDFSFEESTNTRSVRIDSILVWLKVFLRVPFIANPNNTSTEKERS